MEKCLHPEAQCRGKYIPGPGMEPLCNVVHGIQLCREYGPMKEHGFGIETRFNRWRLMKDNFEPI